MHLLWINHFAKAPDEGGGTRHFEMSRELTRLGWDVTVVGSDFELKTRVYTRREGPEDRRVIKEEIDGVHMRRLWAAPYQRNDWRRAWNWVSFGREVVKWTPDRGIPDVVIGSSPHLFAARAGLTLARRWNVPFLFEVRDLWPESMVAAGGRKGLVYFVFDRIAKQLYHKADRIICLARGTVDYLRDEAGISEEKLCFVPNGVDPGAFPDVAERNGQVATFVYAGAHGPANGLDVVLKAAKILEGRDDMRIRLVGDGPAKRGLRELADRLALTNVQFSDPVPKSEMPTVLGEAHAGLMVLKDTPLFAFGVSPNKLFDYMGASLPVVCNVPGEVEWMVREAGAGEQAEDASPKALAAAMTRLADRSAEERAEMGRAGRAWVSREHGRSILAERLDGILREVIQ